MATVDALAVMESEKAALAKIDPQALIESALEKGAAVETLERLVALAKTVRDEQAKEAYNHAMAEFQRQCPSIKRDKTAHIPTKGGGSFSYSYASLDEITSTIAPIMGPLGLSISYRTRHEAGQVVAVCRISHRLGHFEESGDVAIPIGEYDGTGANAAQRVGIANSYARRYALQAITGIAPEEDPDGRPQQKPKPSIQEPQKKAAAAPAPKQEASPQPEQGTLNPLVPIQGKLERIMEKQTKKGQPYLAVLVGEQWASVFDKNVFDSFKARLGKQVIVGCEQSGDFLNGLAIENAE